VYDSAELARSAQILCQMAHNAEQLIAGFAKLCMIHCIEHFGIYSREWAESLNSYVVIFATFHKDRWHYLLL